jgi:pyridoxal 5'-phosphate synthase pdxT subunit
MVGPAAAREARQVGGRPPNAGPPALPLRVGVLALQGDFARHTQALGRAGAAGVEVRNPAELAELDGLVLPGGESTTLLRLIDDGDFVPALRAFHAAGKPLFGTCAGLILLAREVRCPAQFSLGLIDVAVERNAYGRQRESFEARGTVMLAGRPTSLDLVFIRAPRIRRVGPGVETLAVHAGDPVLAQQGTVLVSTFHPELTEDPTVHRYFCDLARAARAGRP